MKRATVVSYLGACGVTSRPGVFRSVSDTAFEAIPAGGIGNDRLEFQVGWNGMAHAVAHTLDWKKSPLVRLRDLPDKLKERECP